MSNYIILDNGEHLHFKSPEEAHAHCNRNSLEFHADFRTIKSNNPAALIVRKKNTKTPVGRASLEYKIIEAVQYNDTTRVIVSDGYCYFIMTKHDGYYTRPTENGLTLKVISGFGYAAIGARKCLTLRTALKWAKE